MRTLNCPQCNHHLGHASDYQFGMPGQDLGTMRPILAAYGFGPPVFNCPKCKCPIKTGAKEWPELSSYRKFVILTYQYLANIVVVPLLVLLATSIGVIVFVGPIKGSLLSPLILPMALCSAIVIYFRIRKFMRIRRESISRSITRTQKVA